MKLFRFHWVLLLILTILALSSINAQGAKTDPAPGSDQTKPGGTVDNPQQNPNSQPGDQNNPDVVVETVILYEEEPTKTPQKPKPKPAPSFFNEYSNAIIGSSVAGGILFLLLIGFIFYKIRQSNRRWEDDEYLKTSSNPFKSTLEQYHSNQ